MSKIPIFAHTQQSFVDAIFSRLEKGKRHAARLYARWFREGSVDPITTWAEQPAWGLAKRMKEEVDFSLPLLAQEREVEGTLKFLLRFSDGLESESVGIPMEAGETLCISSQVGCRMGCAFCETGRMGLLRHLTAAEIVQQVFVARFVLKRRVRNLVFMGMGEPFDNYDEVIRAIRILTDPAGFGMGLRRITVSTSGRVDGIERLSREEGLPVHLAVSVNAPNDAVRRKLMPVNREWDMGALKAAMQAYCQDPRREILIEYVLIAGVNDSLEAADELAAYLKGLRVKVNLIPYNPQLFARFQAPESEVKEAFWQRMRGHGYQTLLRGTKGQGIMAACGQLGNKEMRKKLIVIRPMPFP